MSENNLEDGILNLLVCLGAPALEQVSAMKSLAHYFNTTSSSHNISLRISTTGPENSPSGLILEIKFESVPDLQKMN